MGPRFPSTNSRWVLSQVSVSFDSLALVVFALGRASALKPTVVGVDRGLAHCAAFSGDLGCFSCVSTLNFPRGGFRAAVLLGGTGAVGLGVA